MKTEEEKNMTRTEHFRHTYEATNTIFKSYIHTHTNTHTARTHTCRTNPYIHAIHIAQKGMEPNRIVADNRKNY